MTIIDKIFGDKKGNAVIYLLLAVGILMLSCGGGTLGKEKEKEIPSGEESKTAHLERVLSSIEGVGETEVMISFVGEKDGGSVFAGENKNSENGSVSGVVVVAGGGADAKVREKIIRATRAALGVEIHKIEVFERKEQQ